MDNGTSAHLFSNDAHGDDAYLIKEMGPTSIFDVVLDGVSMGEGGVASQLTVNKLEACNIKISDDIIKCLEEANKELFKKTSGISLTTVTICLKIGNQLTVINSGDSPAYLIRGGDIKELAILDRAEGSLVALTNCVGLGSEFAYHTKQIDLKKGDKLILVTDGISDNLYPKEIASAVDQKTPEQAIDALKQLLSKKQSSNQGRDDMFGRFKPDDATAIVRYF